MSRARNGRKSNDDGRSSGDVVVTSSSSYDIEYTDEVRLESGFKVERGASLSARPQFMHDLHVE